MARARHRGTADDPPAAPGRRRALVAVGAALVAATVAVGGWVATAGSEPSAEAFCDRLGSAADLHDVLLGDAEDIDDGADRLEAAAAVAPEDIAPQADRLADAVRTLADGAAASPTDPQGGVDEALVELQPDREHISEASQAVGRWAATTCGLTLEGTVATTAPPAPPPSADVPAPEGAGTAS